MVNNIWLSSTGGQGAPPKAVPPPLRLLLPEIWSENNRKISITKEICITIDFAPPEKIPGRNPEHHHNLNAVSRTVYTFNQGLHDVRILKEI